MAVWLAEQVGDSGEVVATDIDVTYLKQLNLSNLEVRQHNTERFAADSTSRCDHARPREGKQKHEKKKPGSGRACPYRALTVPP